MEAWKRERRRCRGLVPDFFFFAGREPRRKCKQKKYCGNVAAERFKKSRNCTVNPKNKAAKSKKPISKKWVVAISLSTLYLGLLYNLYVPDWKFEVQITNSSNIPSIQSNTVKCGVRGNLGPACNAVGMIDRSILGIGHLYQRPVYRRTKECSVDSPVDAPAWCQAPFDPEGLLSSIMAVVTCFIGLHFGHILVHFKGHSERILNWIIPSLGLVFFGILLETLGMPLNKPLYTFSYACVTSGAAGLLFIAIYLLVDLYGCRRPTMLLEWMGMNALTLYVLVASNLFFIAIQGFYWKTPENNIVTYIVQHGPWHHVGALRTPASSIRNYSDRSLTT